MIREATEQDVDRIVDLARRLADTVSAPFPFCEETVRRSILFHMSSPDGVVFVSEKGAIAGGIMQTMLSPEPVAFETGWYAEDKSGLRLLRAFEGWARSRGVRYAAMTCAGGAAQKILERSGYTVSEIQMVRSI